MSQALILPDSRSKVSARERFHPFLGWMVRIFCANCGHDGGLVPEDNCNFAFYLCDPCAEKWSPLVDTMLVPDELFWQKVKQEQMEKYGRELTGAELAEILKDDSNPLTKLCKDRKDFNPFYGSKGAVLP